jgi:hypothetical protein
MDAMLLVDFTNLRGNLAPSSAQVIQSGTEWLDLGNYEDLVLYTDVRELSGSASMAFETAAVRQDSAFMPLIPAFPMAVGLRTDIVQASLAKLPPLRYLRWNITFGAVASDVTFRIWLAAYAHA